MLRSELQAELRNNTVQAEIVTPAEQETLSQAPKSFWTKKRTICLGGSILILIIVVTAAAAAAGLLVGKSKHKRSKAANANPVEPVSPTQSPTFEPSFSPVMVPTQVTAEPTFQPFSTARPSSDYGY